MSILAKIEDLAEEIGSHINPTGTILTFAGVNVPSGYLLYDGSAVSRTTYAKLYAVIGDTYGAGDGSTTFNLPNLINRFIEGDTTAGTNKDAGLPNITAKINTLYNLAISRHTDAKENGALKVTVGTVKQNFGYTSNNEFDLVSGFDFDASRCSAIYGNSQTVQPASVTMKMIIKY